MGVVDVSHGQSAVPLGLTFEIAHFDNSLDTHGALLDMSSTDSFVVGKVIYGIC